MDKKILYLIAGETASGKDTIARKLQEKLNCSIVCSHTDRPKRGNETNGVEHYFDTPEEYDKVVANNTIIAATQIGNVRYCATLEDIKNKETIYIIDPKGIKDLKSKALPNLRLYVILIDTPEEIRRKRAASRTNYDMDARIKAESKQFSDFRKNREWDIRIDNSHDDPDIAVNRLYELISAFEMINRDIDSLEETA